MMNVIFVEYRIISEYQKDYMQFMQERVKELKADEMIWMESADQSGVIVEMWLNSNQGQIDTMKQERLYAKAGKWKPMEVYIQGGLEKLHIWEFKQINPSSEGL